MSSPSSIIDPFYRAVYTALADEIDSRMVNLASGTAVDYPSYRHQVGYIEALKAVLSKCSEIELERYGTRPGAGENMEN